MAQGNGGPPGEVWSPEQFRAAQREPIRLPSGAWVRLRPVSAVDLVAAGELPDPLAQHVFRDMPEIEASLESEAQRAAARLEKVAAVNAVVCAVVAEPRIVPDGVGDATAGLRVSELSWQDRRTLFAIACGEIEARLARFPVEPAGGVSAAPGGDGVLDAPELDPRAATG
jgi:hypothetical protein